MRKSQSESNLHNYRYEQAWRGIPVFGQGLAISEDAKGNVRALFGSQISGLDQDITSTTPKLSRAAALIASDSNKAAQSEEHDATQQVAQPSTERRTGTAGGGKPRPATA